MLKNIKSTFFVKLLFTRIEEINKLKFAKYNKSLQNFLEIKLINYKIFSKRYIQYESDGKAKEYNISDNTVVFEGEYLNGKRNGKGKEYNSYGQLIFEGEYLNGKRNGKGCEYNGLGDIEFEGEYFHGKKWNGKGYDIKNNNIYVLTNGKGFVREYYDNVLIFVGNYVDGERNGSGKEYYNIGTVSFEGDYFYGKKWEGKGYDINNNIIYELKNGKGIVKIFNYLNELVYEGEFLNGNINGKGKDFNKNLMRYEGEYLDGNRHGKGKEYYDDSLVFVGEYLYDYKIKGIDYVNGRIDYEGEYFLDSKWNGKGYDERGDILYELNNGKGEARQYWRNGEIYFKGEYINGRNNKKGKEYYYNGKLRFIGEYLEGKKNGKGKDYDFNGDLVFKGEYLKGFKFDGKGYDNKGQILYELHDGNGTVIEYDISGRISYDGECLNGKKHGKGKEYSNGSILYEGEFYNGVRKGNGKEFYTNGLVWFICEYLDGKKSGK